MQDQENWVFLLSLINGFLKTDILLDRKILSDYAIHDSTFEEDC